MSPAVSATTAAYAHTFQDHKAVPPATLPDPLTPQLRPPSPDLFSTFTGVPEPAAARAQTPLLMSSHLHGILNSRGSMFTADDSARAGTPPVNVPSQMARDREECEARERAAKVSGGGSGVACSRGGGALIDLVFDPIFNCYFDVQSNQYYALA